MIQGIADQNGHRMKSKTLNIVLSFLIAGLLICIGLVIRQNMQLSSLQAKLAETELHVYQAEKASDIVLANRSPITQVRPLSSGIYELTTEVAVDPNEYERGMYTVYHMVLNIEVGGIKRKFQFGYASSGLLSHIFYFDYDSDGKIDTGMMEEYAESIPVVGEVVSWL